jgi:hypothetical protein
LRDGALVEDGDGHEAEEENEEGEENAEAAIGIEREGIVDRGHAKKAEAEENSGPNVPDAPTLAHPVAVEAEKQQENGKEERQKAMAARAYGTEDVPAIELPGGKEVERSGEEADPGGAADGMEEKIFRGDAGMNHGREQVQDERHSENDVCFARISETGNHLSVEDAVDEGWDGKDKADEGAGGAYVEKGAGGANGRTNENESAERADERREGNEEWIAGADAMMAASEKMAEFVGEKNGHQRQGKGKASGE